VANSATRVATDIHQRQIHEALVTIPSGTMDATTVKNTKRALKVFSGSNLQHILNNFIINKDALRVTALSYVMVGLNNHPSIIKMAIVGQKFFLRDEHHVYAQI
jgi:chloramphenicol 3-O-phosphotransferase